MVQNLFPFIMNVIIRQVKFATYQVTAPTLKDVMNTASEINPSSNLLPPGVQVVLPLTQTDLQVYQVYDLNGQMQEIVIP